LTRVLAESAWFKSPTDITISNRKASLVSQTLFPPLMGVARSAAGFRSCPSMGEKASGSQDYRKAYREQG